MSPSSPPTDHTSGEPVRSGRRGPRSSRRVLGLTAVALLSFAAAACGDDDDDDDGGVDTTLTPAPASGVPGQPQGPVNTDTVNSQVTPTQAP